jgi:demethylmenaquinone methyltransferase/2-methoxy-6-polyprenyl-1,4-benzoquinol methylase
MRKQQTKSQSLNRFYSAIYRKYDLVNRIFTFGRDQKWRSYTACECLKNNPIDIIDLCCGTGDLCIHLGKKANRDINITGYDFNSQMLEIARKKTTNNRNIDFIRGDVADIPIEDESFDAMTIGFGFRNLTFENEHADIHLKEMHRILRKGAMLYILESSVPSNKLVRLFYTLYLRLFLIPMGALISGSWKSYTYLARSSVNFFDVNEVNGLLSKYGFKIVGIKKFFLGASNLITARKND